MLFWRADHWRKNASRPGSIAKCALEKTLPITRRSGRSLRSQTPMPNKSHVVVSNPPPKPLLIWDGNCDFCRLWIGRWREMTISKVDYITYQTVADRFPEIPANEFNRSLVLIQPDGTAIFAAEAVYRSLAYRRSRQWLSW